MKVYVGFKQYFSIFINLEIMSTKLHLPMKTGCFDSRKTSCLFKLADFPSPTNLSWNDDRSI